MKAELIQIELSVHISQPSLTYTHTPSYTVICCQLSVPSSAKLLAIMETPLDRQSPNKHHLPVARWMAVSSGGQFLSSGWHHYLETSIRPTKTLPGTPESLLDQPRPLPLWQMPNNVTYSQQLPTVQAGGCCSNCTQLMTLLPNGWRHTARKCTWQ